MYARAALLLLLLLSASCLTEAGETLEFPNFVQATVTLPGEIGVRPFFSQAGNYAVVAVGDTLYHMEMRHGRVHGTTAMPGEVSGMAGGDGGPLFAATGGTLCRIQGFEVAETVSLPCQCLAVTDCGGDPLLLMEDGTLVLRSGEDLSTIAQYEPGLDEVLMVKGFPGMVCVASPLGVLTTFSIPDFNRVAENVLNGEITFLENSGDRTLLLSTDTWNEVGCCSPGDLVLQDMFTFPTAPVRAAADSSASFVFAVCPGSGIQVCRKSGEIAWRSDSYPEGAWVSLSSDCETALIAFGNELDILIR